ncbi:MAG: VPLPA-CTERM-specific exosortase XrtD [Gammaproteobacteria bacterium]|nr:VPLPA-CTERM-specific exosortase XrtD [Gammaproteobacteria bacterium]
MTEKIATTKNSNNNSMIAITLSLFMLACVAFLFRDALYLMENWWAQKEEYNHGYLIPVVAAYLLLLRAQQFQQLNTSSSWLGPAMVLLSVFAYVLGKLSAVYVIGQYGFLLALWGLVVTATGLGGLRLFWVPLVYLAFMIPLPNFLYNSLSNELQLISSQIGVFLVRAAGISVFLEGNVIDLGEFQLQVVEACSGLRYLFPLMSFGFLCASLYVGKAWHKVIIFLSSIPLTILMNSFRIGVIGILVEHYGISMARGFLHDFEGWAIFMACVGLLFLEMALFAKLSGRKLIDVFAVDVPPLKEFSVFIPHGSIPIQAWVAAAILVLGSSYSLSIDTREEMIPEHASLSTFPLRIGDWRGNETAMEQEFIDVLKFDDYLLSNYWRESDSSAVNLYIAYYNSQRKGASIHSPASCLPGGGWNVESIDEYAVPDVGPAGEPLQVNRSVIAMGDDRQVVYYWFEQRGRNLTNEYLVKWFMFWDSLRLNRTDGALVRLTLRVRDLSEIEQADRQLAEFLRDVYPKISYYIPQEDTPLQHATGKLK